MNGVGAATEPIEDVTMRWVLVNRLIELIGYSRDAIYAKKKRACGAKVFTGEKPRTNK